MLVNNDIK